MSDAGCLLTPVIGEGRMEKALGHTRDMLRNIRTSRASSALVDNDVPSHPLSAAHEGGAGRDPGWPFIPEMEIGS